MSEDVNAVSNELAELHDAITSTLQVAMPDVVHVEAFPDLQARFNVPALFFGLTEFRPGPDTGTGKTAVHGKFSALILIDAVHQHAPLQCMWIATRLATVLRGQYWGLDFVDCAENVQAEPTSNPQLEAFVVWNVSWTQVFHLGEAEWPWPDESQEVIWDVDVVAG